MGNFTTRQYRILADHMEVYQFMIELYERDWRNGVPAPFLEYALSSDWMTKAYTHRNRLWYDGNRLAAFCFTENPATDIYFSLRPGYEILAPEMIAYAEEAMPKIDGQQQLILFDGQDALIMAAKANGYQQVDGHEDFVFDYKNELAYPLPDGYSFIPQNKLTPAIIAECCWKGFNHEREEGPWNGDWESCAHIMAAPHITPQYPVGIANANGVCVCYAGMWWTPENHLAYMEPLCTVPEERRKGLASAALSELYRRMKPLGATHMTGGANQFYRDIGYGPGIKWTIWKKAK